MIDFLFLALSFIAICGAIVMLINSKTIYSALGLLITTLAIAGLFALLSASFLFVVQIIVYSGAIMTLIVFILMFLNVDESEVPKEPNKYKYILFSSVLILPLNILIISAISKLPSKNMNIVNSDFGSIRAIGKLLFENWLLSFELISILLLIALIGAVVLAKRKKSNKECE